MTTQIIICDNCKSCECFPKFKFRNLKYKYLFLINNLKEVTIWFCRNCIKTDNNLKSYIKTFNSNLKKDLISKNFLKKLFKKLSNRSFINKLTKNEIKLKNKLKKLPEYFFLINCIKCRCKIIQVFDDAKIKNKLLSILNFDSSSIKFYNKLKIDLKFFESLIEYAYCCKLCIENKSKENSKRLRKKTIRY
jgi:hypothetical protein